MSTVTVSLHEENLSFQEFLPGFLYAHLEYPSTRHDDGTTHYVKTKDIPGVLQPFLKIQQVVYNEQVRILHATKQIQCTSHIDAGFVQAKVDIVYTEQQLSSSHPSHLDIQGSIQLTKIPIPFVKPLLERVIRQEFLALRQHEIQSARKLLK